MNAGAVAGDQPIRDAATVILLRRDASGPAVLMGQRGAGAAFMPDKYVFPGGGVDPSDRSAIFARPLSAVCAERLGTGASPELAACLPATAIRELAEETGLLLAGHGTWHGPADPDWRVFSDAGLLPDAAPLRFIYRAITPPGRTRRFDARFFLADASEVLGDPDDFSRASGELSHLHWVALDQARTLNLPFITEIVLAEVAALARGGDHPPVPFFDNSGQVPHFRRIGDAS